jgi:hypothetical protein
MKCPKCESDDVRYSNRHGIDHILRYVFPWIPFRCKECFARFWRFQNPLKSMASRVVTSTLILALAGICLTLWYNDGKELGTKIIAVEKIQPREDSKKERKIIINAPVSAPPTEIEKQQIGVLSTSVPDSAGNKSPEISVGKTAVEPVSGDQTNIISDVKPAKQRVLSSVDVKPSADNKPIVQEMVEPVIEAPAAGKTFDEKTAAITNGTLPDAVSSHRDTNRDRPSDGTRSLYAMTASASNLKFQLTLKADGPIQTKEVFFVKAPPPRLVVDIPGKWKYSGESDKSVKENFVKRIKVGKHPEFLRVVLELDSSDGISQELSESSNGCTITMKK